MFDRTTNQGNLIKVLDLYQRQSVSALLAVKAAHDTAFVSVATLDDHVAALTAANQALEGMGRALLAVHEQSRYRDPDELFVPAMAGPILLAQ